ncbi:MAG: serine hydroxymethyltransferase [Mycoplasmataceae bacterium]|nr:serine hydroxymethyltransferase [Mycoplasmataceae bacterium]
MNRTELIKKIIKEEDERQASFITLIASENYVSNDVKFATGSSLTNKYAEGYPGRRYYGGCEVVDKIEIEAQERLKKLFKVKYVNVQPHSGSQANIAVYNSLLNPGDKILGMSLSSGGHLTHGAKFNLSGKSFESFTYDVDRNSFLIDYDDVEKKALEIKPKLIIAGASAYPREIDFKRFKEIADKVGAILMADIAHIAGPIAAGLHNSPVGYADIITSTTHKTLRGPRSGIIMTNNLDIYNSINKGVFPGTQGGPLMHVIAAKAIAFGEALENSFVDYQKQVIENSQVMAKVFSENGFEVTTGGTDNHLFLVNVLSSISIDGKEAQELLTKSNIIVNMNSIPFDKNPTNRPSGIRIGTPAITTLGATKKDSKKLAILIINVLRSKGDNKVIEKAKKEVLKLLKKWDKLND